MREPWPESMDPDARASVIDASYSGVSGPRVGRALLLGGIALAVFVFHGLVQFRGLVSAEAMEQAQVARNLTEGKGFSTGCVRPGDFGLLARRNTDMPDVHALPDVRTPPLYPLLLSIGFRISGMPPVDMTLARSVYRPERSVMIPFGIVCALVTAWLVYGVGRMLFDERVAVVAFLLYVLSRPVLSASISGTGEPLAVLLVTAACAMAVLGLRVDAERGVLWGTMCFLLVGLFCAAAFSTAYSTVVLLPALLLFARLGCRQRPWLRVIACVLVAVLVITPWLLRNQRLSGSPLGTATRVILHDAGPWQGDAFDRELDPAVGQAGVMWAVREKLIRRWRQVLAVDLRTLGSGLVVCLFLISYFRRFGGEEAALFRWCLALAVVLMTVVVAMGGDRGPGLRVFLPLVTVYGVAFLLHLLESSDYMEPSMAVMMQWILVGIGSVGAALALFVSRSQEPYPPYFPPFIARASEFLGEDEVVCTDMPWAVSWYGRRTAVLLPATVKEFDAVRERGVPVAAAYVTTLSAEDPVWSPFIGGVVPSGFPLRHGVSFPPGSGGHVFLVDRQRWPTVEAP